MSLRLLLSQNTSLTAEAAGPGPQAVVAGDGNLGYYGEVPDTEVLMVTDLLSQIPELNFGTLAGTSITWLKFSYQGKIYYIPKQPVIRRMSWNQLYNAGLIYGTDDFGLANTGYQANQLRIVKSGSYTFKVRTITSDSTDPATAVPFGNGYDTAVHASMWTDLLYRVCSRLVGSYPTAKWANYADSDLTNTNVNEIVRETPNGQPNYVFIRGASSRIDSYNAQAKTQQANSGWRPVLELIAVDQLVTLRDIVGITSDTYAAPAWPTTDVVASTAVSGLSSIAGIPLGFQTPPSTPDYSVAGLAGVNISTLSTDGLASPNAPAASVS